MWRQYVIVFSPALVVDINEETIPLVYYYVSRSSPRRPARGRPLLRIFSLRQLPGSLYRYQNPSRRLMHGCLIVVLAPSVDYPFSGGSRQVALPPLVRLYKGCIGQTRIRNRHRFLLIVLRDEFCFRRTEFAALSCECFFTLCFKNLECSFIVFFKT